MSATTFRSLSLRGGLEVFSCLFAAANVAIMVFFAPWETIPLHLVWLSMTLLYGLRVWSISTTVALVIAVMLATGGALIRTVVQTGEGLEELAVDPLVAGIFVTMAWHARRSQTTMEDLRHTTRERDFIRDASHQLRTPITVARGHAELILETHPRLTVARDVAVIADELKRLSSISDRLLMLVAADEPGFVNPSPVDIGSLVDSTITRWRPVAARRWHAQVKGGGTVIVDRERIECALDALIENAVNATRDGDLIGIVAGVEGHTTTIEVIDEGAGISPGEIPRIFERFSRGDSNGAERNGGTGLGLPIVKAIAEAHGGSVTVSSDPGKGTTFRLRLNGLPVAGR